MPRMIPAMAVKTRRIIRWPPDIASRTEESLRPRPVRPSHADDDTGGCAGKRNAADLLRCADERHADLLNLHFLIFGEPADHDAQTDGIEGGFARRQAHDDEHVEQGEEWE